MNTDRLTAPGSATGRAGANEQSARLEPKYRFFARLPALVWILALVAILIHMAPFWYAQASARGEWTFTGNTTISPDYMQYRVWERQSLREGPIVTNRFTIEPNRAHLPVFYFYALARVGLWLNVRPEFVYAYFGMPLAFLFTILVFCTVRYFFPDPYQTWWTFAVLMLGGGIGAYLKLLQQMPATGVGKIAHGLLDDPLRISPTFEDYRGHYLFMTLFEAHFLFIWLLALGMIVALYFAIKSPSAGRFALVALLLAACTLLHVHEGITLLAVAAGVTLCCWPEKEKRSAALRGLVVCALTVMACYGYLGWLYARSGMPVLSWRANPISLGTLLMAYPVAWGLMAWGMPAYWRRAGYDERFLVGWALGCTAITLSGPFHPFPDRGTLTLPIALYLIAAGIYFARWRRVTAPAIVAAVLLLGGTFEWKIATTLRDGGFRTNAPYRYINASHRRVIDSLAAHADTSDILLGEPADLLWLAPQFPGRFYIGHFFLTPGFRERKESLEHALAEPERLPAVLAQSKATLFFVNSSRDPARLQHIPGLAPLARDSTGWLFAVHAVSANAR